MNIKGFINIYTVNRLVNIGKRSEGGLGVYCKVNIEKNIEVVKVFNEGIILLKYKNGEHDQEDLYMCFTYIPHEKSAFYKKFDFDFYDKITELNVEYSTKGAYFVLGDLNSRVGTLIDYTKDDNLDKFINNDKCSCSNDIPHRASMDTIVNNFGRRLLSMCKSTDLLILNGRKQGDIKGKFTFCNQMGHSVIDYMLTKYEYYNVVTDFKVLEVNEFSDHAPIYAGFSVKNNPIECIPEKTENGVKYILWNKDKETEYKIKIIECLPDFENAVLKLETGDINATTVSSCVEKISDIIYTTAFEVFGKTKQNTSSNQKNVTSQNIWHNNECKLSRAVFHKARNRYYRYPTAVNRTRFTQTRNNYVKLTRKMCFLHKRKTGQLLSDMSKKDPKKFWSTIKPKVKSECKAEVEDLYTHFKGVFNQSETINVVTDRAPDTPQNIVDIDMLDKDFTVLEVINVIKKLKIGKSTGHDNLNSEMFKCVNGSISPILCKLFNIIFKSGVFPTIWTKGILVPVYKKGDKKLAQNYRPITLVSIFSKIFSNLLNARLYIWSEENEKLNNFQFGFRQNKSSIDAVYVLQGIISHTLKNKKKLFCCFVDFEKAFDTVDHSLLWYKLYMTNCSSKIINMIKNIYKEVKVTVRVNNKMSDFFESTIGVKQGEPLSPLLFLLFINDMVNDVSVNTADTVFIQGIPIQLLLFADDTVLFSKSQVSLQNQIDKLEIYCKKWKLKVNATKTKILVFENRRSNIPYQWKYEGKLLEIADSYVYLGILLCKNGNFKQTQKRLSEQGSRALYSMMYNLKNHIISIEKQCEIFDVMISTILMYGCEIWGHHQANDIEMVQTRFCKMVLKASKSSPLASLLGDLGRTTMLQKRQERLLSYWLKILENTDSLMHKIFITLVEDSNKGKTNWASKIRDILFALGLNNYWLQQDANIISIDVIKQRITDQNIQRWRSKLTLSSKLNFYCKFKELYNFERYLSLDIKLAIVLYKFRSSGLKLAIETGRYVNIPKEQRICIYCNMNVIENEYHFLLICPTYSILRKFYIPNYYIQWPNVRKFCNLVNTNSLSTLKKISLYLIHALKLRDNKK